MIFKLCKNVSTTSICLYKTSATEDLAEPVEAILNARISSLMALIFCRLFLNSYTICKTSTESYFNNSKYCLDPLILLNKLN